MTTHQKPTQTPWPQVLATVIACEYDFGAGQALAFGISKTRHFQISFHYRANGELHTGQFHSAVALPQGHLFPITFNPLAPREHSTSATASATSVSKAPLLIVGLAGSILLSLIWLSMMHGCS